MIEEDLNNKEIKPIDLFSVNLQISERNQLPCLEIRKVTTDPTVIKAILKCAYHGVPITVLPAFTNNLRSITTLLEKGIIYKEGNRLLFNI